MLERIWLIYKYESTDGEWYIMNGEFDKRKTMQNFETKLHILTLLSKIYKTLYKGLSMDF